MITLTTDFGYRDPFVGMMKGVIATIASDIRVEDITHGIGAHSITEGSLAIGTSYRYYPDGTVHVVVVDPGVGSTRAPIIVSADHHLFVGPNNGVLTSVIKEHEASEGGVKAWKITNTEYTLKSPGNTFHGRDVFSPIAAWLALGKLPDEMGEPLDEGLVTLPFSQPSLEDNRITGEVIHVDTFGNAISNIKAADVEHLKVYVGDKPLKVRIMDARASLVGHYAAASSAVVGQAACSTPYALVNSSGLVEIFCYQGNVAEALGIQTGEQVVVSV